MLFPKENRLDSDFGVNVKLAADTGLSGDIRPIADRGRIAGSLNQISAQYTMRPGNSQNTCADIWLNVVLSEQIPQFLSATKELSNVNDKDFERNAKQQGVAPEAVQICGVNYREWEILMKIRSLVTEIGNKYSAFQTISENFWQHDASDGFKRELSDLCERTLKPLFDKLTPLLPQDWEHCISPENLAEIKKRKSRY